MLALTGILKQQSRTTSLHFRRALLIKDDVYLQALTVNAGYSQSFMINFVPLTSKKMSFSDIAQLPSFHQKMKLKQEKLSR